MKLDKLIRNANKTYALNLSFEHIRKVKAALKIADYAEVVTAKEVSTIIDIIIAQAERLKRYNPLKAAVEASNNKNRCPICKTPMESITIANNKKALFCKEHNLTLPQSV